MVNSGFKLGVAVSAVLCCAFALSAGEAPPGPKEAAKPPLVSNVFIDTDLRQALQDIASQVGVIIVPDESVSGLVTCELQDVPLDKALEIVLAGTGFVVKKTPDYYLVCSSDPKSASFALISETRLVKLDYVKAATAAKLLSPGFRECVQADAESNAVCITAPPNLLERIVSDLKLIDQPPRHIMLDARIVVMERTDLLNLGIQWTWPQVRAGTFSSAAYHGGGIRPQWPWGIEIGYTPGATFTNALGLALNLLEQNGQATVLANPQLMVQDGKEAEIKVTTEEYFQIVTSGYYTTAQLEKIESGTTLKITPRIGTGGEITLQMETEVSDAGSRSEDDLPIITRRTAKSTVRIEDGGTAAVAGLMDSRSRLSRSRTPGLGDIPIVGELFRYKDSRKSSRQVAIFVTARLMHQDAPEFAAAQADAQGPAALVGPEFKKALRESLSRLAGGTDTK